MPNPISQPRAICEHIISSISFVALYEVQTLLPASRLKEVEDDLFTIDIRLLVFFGRPVKSRPSILQITPQVSSIISSDGAALQLGKDSFNGNSR